MCFWEGDKHGLDLEQFKQIAKEKQIPLRFGFIGKVAYLWDCFQSATDPDHPARKVFKRHPLFPGRKYREGDCPIAEAMMPRLISTSAMLPTEEAGQRLAEQLHDAIRMMERG
jgi:hypothetical protein